MKFYMHLLLLCSPCMLLGSAPQQKSVRFATPKIVYPGTRSQQAAAKLATVYAATQQELREQREAKKVQKARPDDVSAIPFDANQDCTTPPRTPVSQSELYAKVEADFAANRDLEKAKKRPLVPPLPLYLLAKKRVTPQKGLRYVDPRRNI